MDWNDASQRGRHIWVQVREGSARVDPRAQAPWHVRLLRLLLFALLLGLFILLGAFALGIGLVVIVFVGAAVLVRRAWRALVSGFAIGGTDDRARRNVRVVEPRGGTR